MLFSKQRITNSSRVKKNSTPSHLSPAPPFRVVSAGAQRPRHQLAVPRERLRTDGRSTPPNRRRRRNRRAGQSWEHPAHARLSTGGKTIQQQQRFVGLFPHNMRTPLMHACRQVGKPYSSSNERFVELFPHNTRTTGCALRYKRRVALAVP